MTDEIAWKDLNATERRLACRSMEAALKIGNDKLGLRQMTVEQWLAIRKQAGLKIDPETAEVEWTYAQTLDPYGVYPELPEECWQVGREYFARSPGTDIWVWFGDLPEKTRHALSEKRPSNLALSAGLGVRREDDVEDDFLPF